MQVLVAEDDHRMSALLEKTLSEEGHHVVVARDGKNAFEIALYTSFDVIVLDVMLPGMSGTAVARKLREPGRNQTPILMLTARDSAPPTSSPASIPEPTIISPKPFPIDILLARLRAVSRRGAIARSRRLS